MYVKEFKQDLTLSTIGAANSCSTCMNGLLHSVRVYWDWNPAVAHRMRSFRSLSSGSTQSIMFGVSGTTVASSETWYEFFPRGVLQDTTAGSSAVRGLAPVNGYIHTRVTTSSGFAGKVATVVYSLV